MWIIFFATSCCDNETRTTKSDLTFNVLEGTTIRRSIGHKYAQPLKQDLINHWNPASRRHQHHHQPRFSAVRASTPSAKPKREVTRYRLSLMETGYRTSKHFQTRGMEMDAVTVLVDQIVAVTSPMTSTDVTWHRSRQERGENDGNDRPDTGVSGTPDTGVKCLRFAHRIRRCRRLGRQTSESKDSVSYPTSGYCQNRWDEVRLLCRDSWPSPTCPSRTSRSDRDAQTAWQRSFVGLTEGENQDAVAREGGMGTGFERCPQLASRLH